MDIARLITIVPEYEELYNLRHQHYSNQQRRDNIWEEIGHRLNVTGNVCKERWTRIRDNHRKALNLRKTKSGQGASKLKPPKYYQELTFLTPYLNDEEERLSNLSPIGVDGNPDDVQCETPHSQNNFDNNPYESSDTQDSLNASSVTSSRIAGKKSRFAASQGLSTANVLQEYLSRKEITHDKNQSDPMIEFFINMAKTVKTFPIQDQVHIKAQLFQMVNSVEMKLALTSSTPVSNATISSLSGSNERNVLLQRNSMLPPLHLNSQFYRPYTSKEPLNVTIPLSPAANETLHVLSPSPSLNATMSLPPSLKATISPSNISNATMSLSPAANETLHVLSPSHNLNTAMSLPPSLKATMSPSNISNATMSLSPAANETLHCLSPHQDPNFNNTVLPYMQNQDNPCLSQYLNFHNK